MRENITEKILSLVDESYRGNANKLFKETFISEFSIKVFSYTSRGMSVNPLFSKSSPKTILYSFVVVDGMKSVATGHIIYKLVRKN